MPNMKTVMRTVVFTLISVTFAFFVGDARADDAPTRPADTEEFCPAADIEEFRRMDFSDALLPPAPLPLCKSCEKNCYTHSATPGNRFYRNWIYRYADGGEGEGPVVNRKRHGHWVVRTANGDMAEGLFVNDKEHGNWIWQYADGGVAEGPYVNGKLHGRWVVRDADGSVSQGPYVNDNRHGYWVERDVDGSVAKGPYVNGKIHGRWVLQHADGREEIQIWENDELKTGQ